MPETPSYNDLQAFADLWLDSELPTKSIAPLTASLQRSENIEREGVTLTAAARVTPAEIADRIAAGELSVEEGVAEATHAYAYQSPISAANPSSVADALVRTARAQCHKAARRFLADNAEALAHEADAKNPTAAFAIRAALALYGYLPSAPEARPSHTRAISGKAIV